ncbi:MAG TPA: T9SS type A sorting domain-containing protein [Ignavibacteriaceae bacterium]|nr:T9SS type A sorting domain-containing protein [Ignavibacteriaceae bacterium]
MKKILVCCLLIVISSFSFAQSAPGGREEKLQQLKTREDIKVTEVEPNLLKLEYPNGKVLYKNIGDYKPSKVNNINYSPTYDSTIIDLTNIDTTLYVDKYKLWQEVPIGTGPNSFLLVGDVNNNQLPELYGRMKDYTTDYTDIVIFEENEQQGFDSVYSYDTTSIALSIFDIDNDGMDDLHLRRFSDDSLYSGNSFLFFHKDAPDSLAKKLSFIFYPFQEGYQQNDNRFGNWDGDKLTDQIFIRHCCPLSVFFFEFNPFLNYFDSIYSYDYTPTGPDFEGFAIDDFDQDGRVEFFTGSVNGDVLSIENIGNNSYTPNWQGRVETTNAYMFAQTNDIDKNGKKEVWIGGDMFTPEGNVITRITLFEAVGDNDYQIVGRIDLLGIFSFFAQNFQALDVDKDGIEEMMICIEQTVLILKFNGSTNHQTYELFYFRQNGLSLVGRNSVYYGAVMSDLSGDGKEEIIVSMDDIKNNVGIKYFSYIFFPTFPVNIGRTENVAPNSFNLSPSYPNPFNPKVNIKFDVGSTSFTSIKVYNILGKEITTLLEKEISPGSYSISWEARDSNGNLLPSGMYLIRFIANNYSKTIKAILMK